MTKTNRTTKTSKTAKRNGNANGCTLGEYNGNPTVVFPGGAMMGRRKIELVLNNLDVCRAFVESNGQSIE